MRELCGPNIPVLLVGCKRDLRDQAMMHGPAGGARYVTQEQVGFLGPRVSRFRLASCPSLILAYMDILNWKIYRAKRWHNKSAPARTMNVRPF